MTPPRTQTARVKPAERTRAATMAGLRKMPEPMIPPTTIMVPEKSPSFGRYLLSIMAKMIAALPTRGIHHITAIAGDPQRNLDFYAGLLGMRLVKLTVNFDDPAS